MAAAEEDLNEMEVAAEVSIHMTEETTEMTTAMEEEADGASTIRETVVEATMTRIVPVMEVVAVEATITAEAVAGTTMAAIPVEEATMNVALTIDVEVMVERMADEMTMYRVVAWSFSHLDTTAGDEDRTSGFASFAFPQIRSCASLPGTSDSRESQRLQV